MDSNVYNAILKTVCYADIFGCPLTDEELRRWLIYQKGIRIVTPGDIRKANGVIAHKDRFIYMQGRENLIEQKKRKEHVARKKINIARRAISFLRHIPTIKLIGISGSVAMANAKAGDDIDFFIVAQTGTVWLTRFLTTILTELFAKRRRPHDKSVANTICLNMFIDENFLAIPKVKQNLYVAHEVCQLKAMYDKDSTYSRFLRANTWVKNYLPNAITGIRYQELGIKEDQKKPFMLHDSCFMILNWLAKHLQLWYMRRNHTSEIVTDTYLAFHPKDYTHDVLAAFRDKLALYGADL